MPQTPPRPMLLQLLAAPRLLAGGQALHVGSRKALAILALLALDGSATRDRLRALLWPEVDAPAGRRNLRRELFRLRELGVPLREAADGALALDAALAVDALQLLREGCLHDAGSVAAGLALAGLDGVGGAALDDWLAAARDRLARCWRQGVLAQARAAEKGGDLDLALRCFGDLHAADPLREITVRDLMRVHAARGNRNAALHLFDRFAERLQGELTLAPLPETRALAERMRGVAVVVNEAPAAGAAAGPPPAAPSASPLPRIAPFVGRAGMTAALRETWRRGQLNLVAGEAGEGKSRLIADFAATQGAYVHVACRPADREQPFAAAARLLRELLSAATGTALPEDVRSEIARVVPELGAAAALTSGDEQQQFFDACARGVLLLAADNFAAIAIDDWHHADNASRGLLLSIAQSSGTALRWILAYRTSELADAALAQLDALVYAGAAARVALGPLEAADVETLVQRLSGSDAPRFARRLHLATGGNPFFLIETLRHLFERGLVQVDSSGLWQTVFDASTADYHELSIPATVRDAVRARVARLGEGAMRLLEAASLLGDPFAARWLDGATSLSELDRVAAFEAAESAHLLARAGPSQAGDSPRGATPQASWGPVNLDRAHGGYRFAHDLVPQSLASSVSPARAVLLHRKLAQALVQAQGSDPALATRIAHHWEAAHEPRRAVVFRIQAGEAAARLFAHREALAEFERALADGPDKAQEVAIRTARIDALRYLGDIAARGAEAEALMALARTHGDRNLQANAAIQRALALTDANRRREALRTLDHAVTMAPDDEATLLRVLRIAGWAAMTCGETERAREHLLRAIPIAERIDASAACSSISVLLRLASDAGDYDEARRLYDSARNHPALTLRPMIHCQVLADGARLMEACGNRGEALRLQRESLALAQRTGAVLNLTIGRFNMMRTLFNGGDVAAARELALLLAPLASVAGNPQQQYVGLSSAAQLAVAEERWADALATGLLVIALCDGLDDPLQRRIERVQQARSYLAAGEFSAARDMACAAQAIDADGRRVLLSAKAAEIEASLALEPPRAAELLAQLEHALAAPVLPEEERSGAIEYARITQAHLLLALGRHAEAASAVARVCFTPELRAQAFMVELQCAPAMAALAGAHALLGTQQLSARTRQALTRALHSAA